MLTIPQEIFARMLAQARSEAPLEACGMLAGEGERVSSIHPMTNADASPEHYSLVPAEQFKVAKVVRATGERMLAVYHSHPASPARPSREDIRLAVAPGILHVILSLQSDPPVIKAFRIEAGAVHPVPVQIQEPEEQDGRAQ